jgi:hypothetical protein
VDAFHRERLQEKNIAVFQATIKDYTIMNRFFFAPCSSSPLAFFRIGITLIALIQGVWLLGCLPLLYGENGVVPWTLSKGIVAGYMPTLSSVQIAGIPSNITVLVLMLLYLCSLCCLLTGRSFRVFAIIAWALHFIFMNTGFMESYGVETFVHIGLFYCIIMPASSEWNQLFIRVLQFHICIVYLASGIEKAIGEQWWNGEAIWQTLMQSQFSRFDMHGLAAYPWLAKLICWSTLLTECGYPFLVWFKRARPYAYGAVVALHLGIAIFMGLELFAGIMIIFSTAAFGYPLWQQLFERITARRRLARARDLATYIDLIV